MPRNITAATLIVAAIGGLASAQKHLGPEGHPEQPVKIFIGQSLSDATTALATRKVEFGEGGFSFSKGDPDQSNLYFKLDENHTTVCGFFSRSRKQITGLKMVFFPSRRGHNKANETWISATELLLYPDRSYRVHFAPPLTPEQLREFENNLPKHQYPPGRLQSSKNGQE